MKSIIAFVLIGLSLQVSAQGKYFTRNGTISFFSSTPVEDIKAENFGVTAILDSKSGQVEFSLLMKSFNFKKALMQEHFNENYVESDLYPKSTFTGKVLNLEEIDFTTPGTYPAKVKGQLTIHGETKEVTADGEIIVSENGMTLKSDFPVQPSDYKIEIPKVVENKIAREIVVSVNADLEPFKR